MDEPTTFYTLLKALRRGYVLHRPILVEVARGSHPGGEIQIEMTQTFAQPLDWKDAHSIEYANSAYHRIGPNAQHVSGEAVVTIGRSRRCTIRVDNESVSKVHASVRYDKSLGEYQITDEGSRNGTSLGGAPLLPQQPATLWPGVYVSFGDAVFLFLDSATLHKLARLV